MVNFTVGYGAQYRTNHAVTSLHRAVRLVSPWHSHVYERVRAFVRTHARALNGSASRTGAAEDARVCASYTYTRVTHTEAGV